MAAQQPDIKRTDLQQHNLSVPGHEVVQALVDLGPTTPFVKHRERQAQASPFGRR